MTISIILTILASLALVATVYYAGGKMSGGTISQINEQVRALSKNLSLPEPKISQSKNDSFHEVEITGSLNHRSFNFHCFTKKINAAESFTTRFSLAVPMSGAYKINTILDSILPSAVAYSSSKMPYLPPSLGKSSLNCSKMLSLAPRCSRTIYVLSSLTLRIINL